MSLPLTIRNISSTPLELKLIERFEAPTAAAERPGFGGFTEIGRNFTNLTSIVSNTVKPTTLPTAGQLAENAESFVHQDVNIRIEPFKAETPEMPAAEKAGHEVLRLTFECEGQRYRLDLPGTKKGSQTLTPLQPDSKRQFTGIYISDDNYLAIYSCANLEAWMKEFNDNTPLSGLSIPGTHNSPTYHAALPSVRCQAVDPLEQLQNGVRFFDIRVQPQSPDDPTKDALILVHGVFPISLTGNKYLRDLLDQVHAFLDANPSETVIVSLKREGPGQATDQQLSRILHDHYATDPSKWYTEPRIPLLGETRGRIVLMRRFVLDDAQKQEWDGRGWAIDAENWRYNCDHDTHGAVCVQDYCEVNETKNIEEKVKFAQEHLTRSGDCVCPLPSMTSTESETPAPLPFYLNFLSASNFWKYGCWPEKIAARLNPAITKHLCKEHYEGNGDGATGIVVCDWVGKDGDWDLVRCIVGMNARLEMRQRGLG